MEPSIDYDELALRVATQLRKQSLAYAQGRSTLEEEWLREQFIDFTEANAPLIARRITATTDYQESFKSKLKSVINSIY